MNVDGKKLSDLEPQCLYAPIFVDHLNALDLLEINAKVELYDAISHYVVYGIEPKFETDIAKVLFMGFRGVLDSSIKRYKARKENGKKGGAPKGNQNARKHYKPSDFE